MARRFKRTTDAPSPVDDREHGANQSFMVPWDLSSNPSDNQLRAAGKKLGQFQIGDHAIAVLDVDGDNLASVFIDGYQRDGENLSSVVVLEPDNWIFRLHTGKGIDGVDNTLDLRLNIDHCNSSDQRTQRSTMVMNQFSSQTWGWLMDAFWITERRAGLKDEELHLDAAGFLSQFTKNTAVKQRGAVAFNIGLQGGFVSDTVFYAQLFHVFCFLDTPPVSSREICQPPDTATELGIRGDAWFKFDDDSDGNERKAAFRPEDMPEETPLDEGDTFRQVFIYVDTDDDRALLPLNTLNDPQSNMPTTSKIERNPFKFFLRLDEPYDPVYDYSYHSPPPDSYYGATGPQGSLIPVATPPGGAPTPTQTGGSTTTLPDGTEVPDVPTLDDQWEIFNPEEGHSKSSKQVQSGWAEPQSPQFSQRVNVFPLGDASRNPVGTWYATKPKGHTVLIIDVDIKASDPIPTGKFVEMVMQVGPFNGRQPPEQFFHGAIRIDSDPPTGNVTEYVRQTWQFSGFNKEEDIIFLCILERRNDLDDPNSRPEAEIWTLRTRNSRANKTKTKQVG